MTTDPDFHELLVRWFQWGTFCPVMRLHGDREPKQPQHGTTGGAECRSGAENEVWSFGPRVYEICEKYMKIREELRDYTRSLMFEAHERGSPVISTCLYVFPADPTTWEIEQQYMYGAKYLVAPVLCPGQKNRHVYLPEKGLKWKGFEDDKEYNGGQWVEVGTPIKTMPVFVRQ